MIKTDWPLLGIGLAAVETAVNGILALDPEAQSGLTAVEGAVIAVVPNGLGVTLYMSVSRCRLQLAFNHERAADITIRGNLLDIAALMGSKGEQLMLNGRVVMEGDAHLGNQFRRCLMQFDIDWEQQISRWIGDFSAHQLGEVARGFHSWFKQVTEHRFADVGDYLQEEQRVLPAKAEMALWLDAVDVMRADCDRLEARVLRLQKHLSKDSK